MKTYLTKGGFLLASAGCSNNEWDQAFRRTLREIFDDGIEKDKLKKISMDNPVFRTVHPIETLELTHPGEPVTLEGLELDGKLVLIYSPQGLNDTAHTEGCCCCGGNEITNALEVNVNILLYSLLH